MSAITPQDWAEAILGLVSLAFKLAWLSLIIAAARWLWGHA